MTEQESDTPTGDNVPTPHTTESTTTDSPDAVVSRPTTVARAAAPPQEEADSWLAQKMHAIEQLHNIFGFSYDVAQQAVDYIVDTDNIDSTQSTIDVTACYNYILDAGLGLDRGGPITPRDDCPHVSKHYQITTTMIPLVPTHAPCSYVASSPPTPPSNTNHNTGTTTTKDQPQGRLKSDLMYQDTDDTATTTTTTTNTTAVACHAKENWLCLECGVVRCSRYCLGHALQHWQETCRIKADDDGAAAAGEGEEEGGSVPQDHNMDGHCLAVSVSDLSLWCHVCQSYISTAPGSTGHVLQPLIQQLEYHKFHGSAESGDIGDITIRMDDSQMPNTKRMKHSNEDGDINVDDDEDEIPNGENGPTTGTTDPGVEDDAAPHPQTGKSLLEPSFDAYR